MRTKELTRCVRRLEVRDGEKRAKRRDTHFMYASSENFSVMYAVEIVRSNSSAHGSAKLSSVANAELHRVRDSPGTRSGDLGCVR
jgi:hypothetical protein